MQENNFENQVRQTLDSLRLTPAGPVWEKIEKAIKKRRERRLVFWLLPLFLFAGGLVWWQSGDWFHSNTTQQATVKKLQPATPTFSKPHIVQLQQASNVSSRKENKVLIPKNTAVVNEASIQKSRSNITKAFSLRQTKLDQITTQHADLKTGSLLPYTTKNNQPGNSTEKQKAPQQPVASVVTDTNNSTTTEGSAIVAKEATTQKKDSSTAVLQPAAKKSQIKKRFQWSIVSHIGASNSIEKLIDGFGAKSYAADTYPTVSYSSVYNVSNRGNTGTVVYRQLSTPTKGAQFSIGTLIKKPIRKKSFLLSGLYYSFYSYQNRIGSELPLDDVQSANIAALNARKVFLNNSNHTFVSRFHFIELPVGIEYQLLRNLPLHVQHGFAITHLIAGNALQYDYSTNTYYQRSGNLRKTGLSFFTAIQYTLWRGKTWALQAGPRLQYGLQPLFKNTSGNHLLSGGLSIGMSF